MKLHITVPHRLPRRSRRRGTKKRGQWTSLLFLPLSFAFVCVSSCSSGDSTVSSNLPAGVFATDAFDVVSTVIVDDNGDPCKCAVQTVLFVRHVDGAVAAPIFIVESPYYGAMDTVKRRLAWQHPVWAISEKQPFIRLPRNTDVDSVIILVRPLPVIDGQWRQHEIKSSGLPSTLILPVQPRTAVDDDSPLQRLLNLVIDTYKSRPE